ncbi:hypothetical protein CBS147332_9226 [Penicillium roqueforti]|nr:hypothetical protein CBS147332_9226 [Penicillium roqueforti]KAI3103743.1 hypothetical protein CBS147331_7347 [Penicillium roqueforti]
MSNRENSGFIISVCKHNVVLTKIVVDKIQGMKMINACPDLLEAAFLVDRAPVPQAVPERIRVFLEAEPGDPVVFHHAAKIAGDIFIKSLPIFLIKLVQFIGQNACEALMRYSPFTP